MVTQTRSGEYEMRALSTKWRYEKLAAVICVPPTTQNLVISHSCFAEDGKEITDLKRTCRAIILLIETCLVTLSLPLSSSSWFVFSNIPSLTECLAYYIDILFLYFYYAALEKLALLLPLSET